MCNKQLNHKKINLLIFVDLIPIARTLLHINDLIPFALKGIKS